MFGGIQSTFSLSSLIWFNFVNTDVTVLSQSLFPIHTGKWPKIETAGAPVTSSVPSGPKKTGLFPLIIWRFFKVKLLERRGCRSCPSRCFGLDVPTVVFDLCSSACSDFRYSASCPLVPNSDALWVMWRDDVKILGDFAEWKRAGGDFPG